MCGSGDHNYTKTLQRMSESYTNPILLERSKDSTAFSPTSTNRPPVSAWTYSRLRRDGASRSMDTPRPYVPGNHGTYLEGVLASFRGPL